MLQKIALFYKIFLSRYLFLWWHELASSFLLFRLHKFFLKMIINFSKRHKLHLLLTLLQGLHCLLILHLMLKGLLLSLSAQMCFDRLNCQNTNVGKCFLSLIDKHFLKSNPLHKIFNRNTLKLSYSCMGNIKTIISNHNKAEINKATRTNDQKKN